MEDRLPAALFVDAPFCCSASFFPPFVKKPVLKHGYHETDQKDIKLRHFKLLTIVRGT